MSKMDLEPDHQESLENGKIEFLQAFDGLGPLWGTYGL